jgi:ppGpp synthetase/RelA/SpoT-type nucleotidyltranferase
MFNINYKGLKIIPSYSAMRELMYYGFDIYDVIKILENGYDAPRKRKKDVIEKWLDKGNKTYNIVIGKNYNELLKEEVWVLIHIGKFARRKK